MNIQSNIKTLATTTDFSNLVVMEDLSLRKKNWWHVLLVFLHLRNPKEEFLQALQKTSEFAFDFLKAPEENSDKKIKFFKKATENLIVIGQHICLKRPDVKIKIDLELQKIVSIYLKTSSPQLKVSKTPHLNQFINDFYLPELDASFNDFKQKVDSIFYSEETSNKALSELVHHPIFPLESLSLDNYPSSNFQTEIMPQLKLMLAFAIYVHALTKNDFSLFKDKRVISFVDHECKTNFLVPPIAFSNDPLGNLLRLSAFLENNKDLYPKYFQEYLYDYREKIVRIGNPLAEKMESIPDEWKAFVNLFEEDKLDLFLISLHKTKFVNASIESLDKLLNLIEQSPLVKIKRLDLLLTFCYNLRLDETKRNNLIDYLKTILFHYSPVEIAEALSKCSYKDDAFAHEECFYFLDELSKGAKDEADQLIYSRCQLSIFSAYSHYRMEWEKSISYGDEDLIHFLKHAPDDFSAFDLKPWPNLSSDGVRALQSHGNIQIYAPFLFFAASEPNAPPKYMDIVVENPQGDRLYFCEPLLEKHFPFVTAYKNFVENEKTDNGEELNFHYDEEIRPVFPLLALYFSHLSIEKLAAHIRAKKPHERFTDLLALWHYCFQNEGLNFFNNTYTTYTSWILESDIGNPKLPPFDSPMMQLVYKTLNIFPTEHSLISMTFPIALWKVIKKIHDPLLVSLIGSQNLITHQYPRMQKKESAMQDLLEAGFFSNFKRNEISPHAKVFLSILSPQDKSRFTETLFTHNHTRGMTLQAHPTKDTTRLKAILAHKKTIFMNNIQESRPSLSCIWESSINLPEYLQNLCAYVKDPELDRTNMFSNFKRTFFEIADKDPNCLLKCLKFLFAQNPDMFNEYLQNVIGIANFTIEHPTVKLSDDNLTPLQKLSLQPLSILERPLSIFERFAFFEIYGFPSDEAYTVETPTQACLLNALFGERYFIECFLTLPFGETRIHTAIVLHEIAHRYPGWIPDQLKDYFKARIDYASGLFVKTNNNLHANVMFPLLLEALRHFKKSNYYRRELHALLPFLEENAVSIDITDSEFLPVLTNEPVLMGFLKTEPVHLGFSHKASGKRKNTSTSFPKELPLEIFPHLTQTSLNVLTEWGIVFQREILLVRHAASEEPKRQARVKKYFLSQPPIISLENLLKAWIHCQKTGQDHIFRKIYEDFRSCVTLELGVLPIEELLKIVTNTPFLNDDLKLNPFFPYHLFRELRAICQHCESYVIKELSANHQSCTPNVEVEKETVHASTASHAYSKEKGKEKV